MSDLADLTDLIFSESQEHTQVPLPSPGLWSHRRPVLLPPSPLPGTSAPSELSPPPFPRHRLGVGATKNGDIYIYGGWKQEHTDLVYRYSAKDNTLAVLQCTGDNPGSRYDHAMTVVGNSILALHGGKDPKTGGRVSDASLFLCNLVSRKWRRIPTTGDTPGRRQHHSMAAIGTTIFIFGDDDLEGQRVGNELWAFDLKSVRTQPKWELVTPSSTGKPSSRNTCAFVSYRNQLIVFGGWVVGQEGDLNDTWSFDTDTKSWSQLQCTGDIPSPRSFMGGAVLDDVMYIIGGYNAAGAGNISAFKISENKWFRVEGTEKAERRDQHVAACVGTKIFILGGESSAPGDGRLRNMVAVLDTKHINNPNIHTPERLMQLDLEFQITVGVDIRVGRVMRANAELERRLAELELDKDEVVRRLEELEEEKREARRQELVAAILNSMPQVKSPADLQGVDAQTLVDFLTEVLESRVLLQSNAERRYILHQLRKIIKSAHIFPRSTELRDVQCNLSDPFNSVGGYGLIFKGTLDGQTVCVKAVRVDGSGPVPEKIMRAQAGELALLGHVSHPNVIPLYGAYLSAERNPRVCMVSPWMENGDLVDFLHKHPNTPRIPLMSDVAAGLQFLHSMDIVHADLKARNVLVSRSLRAILADFGVSTICNTSVGSSTAADFSGTAYWMAPELLTAAELPPPTPSSDMWGFGCICFEAITGQTPFLEHYKYPIQLVGAFMRGGVTPLRPKRNGPPTTADGGPLMVLAEKCWDYEPDKRLTAAEAVQSLNELNVEDKRPSIDEELAMFEAVKSKRAVVKIDYRNLLFIVQKKSAVNATTKEAQRMIPENA